MGALPIPQNSAALETVSDLLLYATLTYNHHLSLVGVRKLVSLINLHHEFSMFSIIPSTSKIAWPRHAGYRRRSSKSQEPMHFGPFNYHRKEFHHRDHQQFMDQFRATQDFWHDPFAQSLSFEDLVSERSYLLNSLQNEDRTATELLKRIASLQDNLNLGLEIPARKKTTKTLGWLKYRLLETNTQEKSILNRLGQISYEIQHRDRLRCIENQRFLFPDVQPLYQGFQQMQPYEMEPMFHVPDNSPQGFVENYLSGQNWSSTVIPPFVGPNNDFPTMPPHAKESELSDLGLTSDGGLSASVPFSCKTPMVVSSNMTSCESVAEEQHLEPAMDKTNEEIGKKGGIHYDGFFHASEDVC